MLCLLLVLRYQTLFSVSHASCSHVTHSHTSCSSSLHTMHTPPHLSLCLCLCLMLLHLLLLQMVPGQPLATPLIIAAHFADPVRPTTPSEGATPTPRPTPPAKGDAKGPVLPKEPVFAEPPPAGHKWETADNEFGRVVNLTLHSTPPLPLRDGLEVAAQLATVNDYR